MSKVNDIRRLDDDRQCWRKQRHTARKIWSRLTEEEGAKVPEARVRQYVAMPRRVCVCQLKTVTQIACKVCRPQNYGCAQSDVLVNAVKPWTSKTIVDLDGVAFPSSGPSAIWSCRYVVTPVASLVLSCPSMPSASLTTLAKTRALRSVPRRPMAHFSTVAWHSFGLRYTAASPAASA